jgi:NAD(P) transhydrogenase subunit beta
MLDAPSLPNVAYLAAAGLFIFSLGGLSTQETARRGNLAGILGMLVAVAATLLLVDAGSWDMDQLYLNYGAILIGGAVGAGLAVRVAMTAMPQLVAILHSFVGLAAVLVGISTYLHPHDPGLTGASLTVHLLEIWVGVAVGAITFTGSVVAWGKLRGSISGNPLLLPRRHLINGIAVGVLIAMVYPFIWLTGATAADGGVGGMLFLVQATVIACALGVHLVMAIGGADMPVVVSLLNSYSGWAAAAAGFMLGNDALIVTGALVGSSGAILSYIMCEAMNRSIWSVVFGGFGTDSGAAPAEGAAVDQGEVQPTTADEVAALAHRARNIVIVPGYGMAVARAQHLVHEFSGLLRKEGVNVRYAIHPVAGRLPGHMNVLLAEAGVPYDIVLEMDEIDEDLPSTDLVLVIGANDIVNPGAETDTSSPIYGMPVLQVWNSQDVIVFKRSMRSGYAGVQNPLFFKENTQMLFGDAKDSMQAILEALRKRSAA